MDFKTHMDNVAKVEERGSRLKVTLKNGVVLEDQKRQFTLDEEFLYHINREK